MSECTIDEWALGLPAFISQTVHGNCTYATLVAQFSRRPSPRSTLIIQFLMRGISSLRARQHRSPQSPLQKMKMQQMALAGRYTYCPTPITLFGRALEGRGKREIEGSFER